MSQPSRTTGTIFLFTSAVLESRTHAMYFHVLIQFCFSRAWKSLWMSCAHKSKRNQLLQHNLQLNHKLIVGSLPLAKNAKHSPSTCVYIRTCIYARHVDMWIQYVLYAYVRMRKNLCAVFLRKLLILWCRRCERMTKQPSIYSSFPFCTKRNYYRNSSTVSLLSSLRFSLKHG